MTGSRGGTVPRNTPGTVPLNTTGTVREAAGEAYDPSAVARQRFATEADELEALDDAI